MLYASPPGNVTQRLRLRLLHFLLPAPCLACAEPVWEPRGSLGLCPLCRRRLVKWPERGCGVCGRPIAGEHLPPGYRCGDCRRHPPPYDRLLSAWSYQPPVVAALTGLKFRRLEYLGSHVGLRLAELFRPELPGCELVVPVPLYWTRHLARGYNQAAAIARPLARALDLPVASVLYRRRPTPPQSRLDRKARRRNLRAAFAVRRSAMRRSAMRRSAMRHSAMRRYRGRCNGRHILLVDDVVTTGATLRAAATALKRAGARRVTALTAARTPTPKEAELLPQPAGRRDDPADFLNGFLL